MKTKIYNCMLVAFLAVVCIFIVPREASAAKPDPGWVSSFCNIEYPDGTYSIHQECDEWGGSCGDQYCCSDYY